MKKTLYIILLATFISFVSCNDDKEDEIKIDDFDFTFINEKIDENTIKIYGNNQASYFDNTIILYNGHPEKKFGEWFLGASLENDKDASLILSWELKYGEKKTEVDTFKISKWRMDISRLLSEPEYSYYQGYVVVRSFKLVEDIPNKPLPILTDSLYMEGSFNLQFINEQKKTKFLKGIFNFAGYKEEFF